MSLVTVYLHSDTKQVFFSSEGDVQVTEKQILDEGKKVFALEIEAMERIKNNLGQNFVDAVKLILNIEGNVIFSGVGKSGHVGRKLAATFSSTGTTSFFVHADEAAHGDLGMIRPGDVFVGLSFSGESNELLTCMPALKNMGIPIIAITGKANSSLAKAADVALVTPIDREACPLNLAPTSSTTITMALGDAIAGALIVAKNFGRDDFARSHPAGQLGRRLLLKTSDVMRGFDAVPAVDGELTGVEAVTVMAKKHIGCFVVMQDKKAVGIFTEGDLTRVIRDGVNFSEVKAKDLMTAMPKCIHATESAFIARKIIEEHMINQLIVLDDNDDVIGIVHVQDLIAAQVA